MSTPLDGQVTRPNSFDPRKNYALVVARGDEWLGDYDIIDAQRILRADMALMSRLLFHEGAILRETGGTIASPVVGVVLGGDQLGSAGEYLGLETQLYTVRIAVGGGAGAAAYSWASTGADGPTFPGETRPITAIAPTLVDALADLETYAHPVGILGVQVVFVNAIGLVTVGNTWVVQATYGAHAPEIDGTDITIRDLIVPVEGKPHRVAGATLSYAPAASGISLVYAEWLRTVVTHLDDPDLMDPPSALSNPLSDTPQAWRERWEVTLRTTDTSDVPLGLTELERRVFALYQWDRATDVVTKVVPNPYAINIALTEGPLDARRLLNVKQNKLLEGIFAEHTGLPHGSFVVEPLGAAPRASLSTNAPSPGKIRIGIPPLRAFVEGVQIHKTEASEIELDQATDVATVTAEAHVYTAANNPFRLNSALGDPAFPAKQVTQLTATVRKTVSLTKGADGSQDLLPNTPVSSIISVTKGATTYLTPASWKRTGDTVDWEPGPAVQPNPGDSYQVVFEYTKVMVSGVDFTLSPLSEVDFAPGGDDPWEGSTFNVTYEKYLPRTDVILLRPDGELAIVKGLPAEAPAPPPVPLSTMPYVLAEIPPNSVAVRLRKFTNDTVTMERLNQVLEALDEQLINTARQDLVNQAQARTTGSFIDIYAEAFTKLDLADMTYNVGIHAFDATIDTEVGELTLPFTETIAALTRQAAPVGQTDVRVGGAFFTIPFTDELAIDAPKWSADYPVNPFSDFRPEPPVMRVDPSRDEWVDTTTINTSRRRVVQNGKHLENRVVARRTEVQTRVTEIPALFMRQITVNVAAYHLVPGEKVRCKIDRKDVAFTAVVPSVQGTDAFTVLAGADGSLTATFTVPTQVPNGTVTVELYGDQAAPGSVWPGSYSVRSMTPYTSAGTRREVANETLTTIVRNDPIAQSFVFPANRMVSKLDIPLAAKAAGTTPLIFELRATDRSGDASTPINEVLARQTKLPSALNVGVASSNLFVPDDPVMCFANAFRALVLRSASNAYRAYVAQVGGNDRSAGGFINVQQIESGIFLRSSNNSDWEDVQLWDMRLKVWVAKMSSAEARLYVNRVSTANTTGFYLAPDQVVPDGTSIEWQYSVDGLAINNGGKVWRTFEPFTVVELPAVATDVDVRAILRTSDLYVTPAINRRNLSLQVFSNKTAGKYVSLLKTFTADGTQVSGGIELQTPAGAGQTVYVSLDDGASFTAVLTIPGADGVVARDGFTAYRFVQAGLPSGKRLRVMVAQTTGNRALRPRARALYAYAPA